MSHDPQILAAAEKIREAILEISQVQDEEVEGQLVVGVDYVIGYSLKIMLPDGDTGECFNRFTAKQPLSTSVGLAEILTQLVWDDFHSGFDED